LSGEVSFKIITQTVYMGGCCGAVLCCRLFFFSLTRGHD